MSIDLTPVFEAVIALLAALITYTLIPWIQARTTEAQRSDLMLAARCAVYAAEQLYGRDSAENDRKLSYAMALLRRQGFTLDAQAVRAAVEQAVYAVKGGA